MTAINMILLLYVLHLLFINYTTQRDLRGYAEGRFIRETERLAESVEYFMAQSRRDIDLLATDDELLAYFKNKALGMSLQYGLRATLYQLKDHCADLLTRQSSLGTPLFSSILVAETNGLVLIENDQVRGNGGEGPLPFIDESGAKVRYLDQPGAKGFYVLEPVRWQERVVGVVVATLSLDEFIRQLEGSLEDHGYKWCGLYEGPDLVYGVNGTHEPPRITHANDKEGASSVLISNGKVFCRVPVKSTPYALGFALSARQVFGPAKPLQQLFGLGAAVALVLFGLLGILRHIERKRIEKVLREERQRLANVIEGTNVGTWVWNVQTGKTVFNDRWAEMAGYTLAELEPVSIATWEKLAHPDDLKKSEAALQDHFSGRQPNYDCELRMKRRDGHWVWVHDRGRVVTWTDAGKPLLMYGTHSDITQRKFTEARLHESEQNFRTFFNTVDDLFFVSTPEGRILFSNRAVCEKLGYEEEELQGMHLLDVHPPACRQEAERIFGAMLRGEEHMCPIPLQRKDGSTLPVETRAWLGTWNGDTCLYGACKDLSRQEEALQMFHKLFDNNPALMTLSSIPDRVFMNVNNAFLETLGYERDEVLGKTADELHLYEDENQKRIVNEILMLRGAIDREELRVRGKRGAVLSGLFSGEIIENQGKKFLLTVMTDITLQKKAEKLLRRSVELETRVAEMASHFVNIGAETIDSEIEGGLGRIGRSMGIDRAYVFLFSNVDETMTNTHEWCAPGIEAAREHLQGLPLTTFPWWICKLKRQECISVQRVDDLGPEAVAEKDILLSQGIQSILVVPLVWNNRVEGFIGFDAVTAAHEWSPTERSALEFLGTIIINALKRKGMDEELARHREALEALNRTLEEKVRERTRQLEETQQQLLLQDKMASVGQLAAGIAHEINNPVGFVSLNFATMESSMRAVMGLLQEYREALKEADSATSGEMYDRLRCREEEIKLDFITRDFDALLAESHEGFERITSIINSMRDFSRADTSGHREGYDLNKRVRDTLIISRNAYKYHADVEFEEGDIPMTQCVPSQINQVLLNLIVNAAQAIESRPDMERGLIHIRTWQTDDAVWCAVRDNGSGIAEEQQRRVFDPFFTTKDAGKGTGLGLSISYDIIVSKHKGTFQVQSRKGEGATFLFSLPKEMEQ